MATINAIENITLDGVMQAPAGEDEDTRGGFQHGGWANGYQDEVQMKFMGEGMSAGGAMLFGRRTYDQLVGFWLSTDQPNPFSEVLEKSQKYVVSRSSETELAYPNSTLLVGEAAETVKKLKSETNGTLAILGSGELVRSLHAAGLMDAYTIQVFPIVLGSGQKLFEARERADLILEKSAVTTTGVFIGQYSVKNPGNS